MSWTPDEQRTVAQALLGSWPGTVAAWGREAVSAYIGELEARGLSAGQVLTAIRTWPAGSDFPPSAPNLAAAARKDPSVPTFSECYQAIYGRGGVLKAREPYNGPVRDPEASRDRAAYARLEQLHPLIGAFVHREGLRRLRMLEVDSPDYGELRRKELERAWDAFVEAQEGREIAALASGQRRGEIGRFNPLAALGAGARSGKEGFDGDDHRDDGGAVAGAEEVRVEAGE